MSLFSSTLVRRALWAAGGFAAIGLGAKAYSVIWPAGGHEQEEDYEPKVGHKPDNGPVYQPPTTRGDPPRLDVRQALDDALATERAAQAAAANQPDSVVQAIQAGLDRMVAERAAQAAGSSGDDAPSSSTATVKTDTGTPPDDTADGPTGESVEDPNATRGDGT